eukprot:gene5105-8703_t
MSENQKKGKSVQTTVYNQCKSLEEFSSCAEALALKDSSTRYTIKYKNTTGQVVMSATNDKILYKFTTEQAGDVKHIEKVNGIIFRSLTKTDKDSKSQKKK